MRPRFRIGHNLLMVKEMKEEIYHGTLTGGSVAKHGAGWCGKYPDQPGFYLFRSINGRNVEVCEVREMTDLDKPELFLAYKLVSDSEAQRVSSTFSWQWGDMVISSKHARQFGFLRTV